MANVFSRVGCEVKRELISTWADRPASISCGESLSSV